MQLLIDLVRGIRNVRDEYQVEPGRKITAQVAERESLSVEVATTVFP